LSNNQTPFKDHFSGHAEEYASFRPTYPTALFQWLAEHSPQNRLAWDCASGNGQAAQALVEYFDAVVASDASSQQLQHASEHPRIDYRVEAAENSSLAGQSVDLVTVAQAYHWFDHDRFHREVERVLKPGGLLAVWTYKLAMINAGIDALVYDLYENVLGQYWPEERTFIERDYADFSLPWQELSVQGFSMTVEWRLDQLLGYLGTWSALKRYRKVNNDNPLENARRTLSEVWGKPEESKTVEWPLVLRVCRKPD